MELPHELAYSVAQQVRDYEVTHAIWNASLACLAYDYFLTLDDEVRFIWGQRLSKARILFWVNRYWAVINIIIYNVFLNWRDASDDVCQFSFKWFAYTAFVSHFSIGAILSLRLHAIYSCSRIVLYTLYTLLCSELIAEIILIVLISDHFSVLHLPSKFPGCAPANIVSYAWTYWVPMTLFESVLFLLAAVKAIQYLLTSEFRTKAPNLAFVLVRDSTIYFGSVLALILLNLVIWKTGRPSLFIVFPSTVPAFHSILGCRMLFNMHKALENPGEGDTAMYNTMIPLGPLQFTPQIHSEQATELPCASV